MPNPYLTIGLLIAWIASAAAVGYWQRHDGAAQAQAACSRMQAAQAAQAATQIDTLQTQARATEAAQAQAVNKISSDYQEDLQNVETQRQAALAAAATARRVWLSQSSGASPMHPCDSQAGATATSTGGRDDCQAGRLSGPDADNPGIAPADLINLASDADAVAVQLKACQSVVSADRGPLAAPVPAP